MKRLVFGIFLGVLMAGVAMAQWPGVPVGSVVDPGKAGAWQAGGVAGVYTDGPKYIGARGTFGLSDDVTLFADLGRISSLEESATATVSGGSETYDESFGATAIQLGAIWDLPWELPYGLDLGARVAVMRPIIKGETWSAADAGPGYSTSADVDLDVSIIGGSVSAMVSRDMANVVPGLAAYGFAGFHVVRTKVEWSYTVSGGVDLGFGFGGVSGSYSESGSETTTDSDPGIGGGVVYNVGAVSIYVEIAHVGDVVAGAGALVNF